MTKQRLVPTVALLLVALGGLVYLFSLAPRNTDGKRDDVSDTAGSRAGRQAAQPSDKPEVPQAGNAEPHAKEDDIHWGEPVRGLRLGISLPSLADAYDIDKFLPGEHFYVELLVENVSGKAITADQYYCMVALRAKRREGELFLDVPPLGKNGDPLFHVDILLKGQLEPGERTRLLCEMTKGFLRIVNSRYGPFLAGRYTLSGEVKLTLRSEPGARGEPIHLMSGPASFGIRDRDWGPAHDGVQIALAEYRYRSPEADWPVFALICRNSSDKHVQLVTGLDPIQFVTVTKPNGKPESLLCGLGIGEGSMGFDLKPGEIQLERHQFLWRYLKEPRRGEYKFSVSTSFFSENKRSPVYTTNDLKLKLPE